MCGLVATFGNNLVTTHEKAFKTMLILDQLRGDDSTGVAFVPRNDASPTVVKALGNPSNLFEMKSFDKGMGKLNRVLIGHNRFATQGKVITANAHPFTFGDITGVHNGTLRVYNKLKGYSQYDVDSQVLYNHIDEEGLDSLVENCTGAMALIWWNEAEESFNFYRNAERPLFIAHFKGGNGGFLASEAWMISVAASRNSVEIEQIIEVPENNHVIYDLSKVGTPLGKPTMRYLKKEVETEYPLYNGYFGYADKSSKTGKEVEASRKTLTLVTDKKDEYPIPKNVFAQYVEVRKIHNIEQMVFEDCADGQEYTLSLTARPSIGKLALGDIISGDCYGYILEYINGKKNVYYSLLARTVEVLTPSATISPDDNDEVEEGVSTTPLFDAKGVEISEKEWYKRYSSCSNCTGDVSPGSLFSFGKDHNSVFCDECLTDPVKSKEVAHLV